MSYRDERWLEEQELEDERRAADRSYIPPFCRTYDELREWRAGILTEAELRERRERERGTDETL